MQFYKPAQIMKQKRVILLHGNRGILAHCYQNICALRSHSPLHTQPDFPAMFWGERRGLSEWLMQRKMTVALNCTDFRSCIAVHSISLLMQPIPRLGIFLLISSLTRMQNQKTKQKASMLIPAELGTQENESARWRRAKSRGQKDPMERKKILARDEWN